MWNPVPRLATAHLTAIVKTMPVAVIMGARQTGKTTLKQQHPLLGRYPRFTLDRADTLAQATEHPQQFLAGSPELALDQVQRLPTLFPAIRELLDHQPRPRSGQIVLTSSANLLNNPIVEESLRGRAGFTTLWPLTRREMLGLGSAGIWSDFHTTPPGQWLEMVRASPAPNADWRSLAAHGSHPTPGLLLTTSAERAAWFQAYIDTYLSRDLPEITAVENAVGFHHLMRIVCQHIGQTVNQAAWARDAGGMIPVTARRYLDLMETSYQLIRVPAFDDGGTPGLVKAPKAYWSDTGLAMSLAGVKEPTDVHLENIVVNDLVAWRDAQALEPRLFHWRTRHPHTVDLVIEYPDGRLLAVDVRSRRQLGAEDINGLNAFRQAHEELALGGLVLYDGSEVLWMADGVLAAPWWRVC